MKSRLVFMCTAKLAAVPRSLKHLITDRPRDISARNASMPPDAVSPLKHKVGKAFLAELNETESLLLRKTVGSKPVSYDPLPISDWLDHTILRENLSHHALGTDFVVLDL